MTMIMSLIKFASRRYLNKLCLGAIDRYFNLYEVWSLLSISLMSNAKSTDLPFIELQIL